MATENSFKCHNCRGCFGQGCTGELPGMGGVDNNRNFILNCQGWKKYHNLAKAFDGISPRELNAYLRLAPMTGAQENIGWPDEESFYEPFLTAVYQAKISLSIGDGCPDNKLKAGIDALNSLSEKTQEKVKAAVFFKPYSQEKIFERAQWSYHTASYFGIDIDAYNIVTMRNKVHLECKTADDIKQIRKRFDLPFVIKGVFTQKDIELVKEAKPDVVLISNHGGRIDTETGSTADFLSAHSKELLDYCGELWVDGGIRTGDDLKAAVALGAKQVLVGRPLATAFCFGGEQGVKDFAQQLLS